MLKRIYLAGWWTCCLYWLAITVNRSSDNSLGLYDLRKGESALAWELIFYVVMVLLPILAVVLVARMLSKRSVSVVEGMIALVACGLFLYNFSFVRG